jgi:hypothetical protein
VADFVLDSQNKTKSSGNRTNWAVAHYFITISFWVHTFLSVVNETIYMPGLNSVRLIGILLFPYTAVTGSTDPEFRPAMSFIEMRMVIDAGRSMHIDVKSMAGLGYILKDPEPETQSFFIPVSSPSRYQSPFCKGDANVRCWLTLT